MERKKIVGLRPEAYEHPFDRRAIEALKNTPGLEKFVKWFNEHGIERMLRIIYTGSYIKINKDNFSEVYKTLIEACDILNMSKIPDVYVMWDYGINAMTAGVENPLIVLNSGSVDLLSREELLYLIGHELGHIKSRHVLYHQMAMAIPMIVGRLPTIGQYLTVPLELSLLNWMRMSEFTADRAGLLVCQDVEVAAKTMMKGAGLPRKYFDSARVEDFVSQAKEFESYDYDALDKVAKTLSIMWEGHPWTVMRAAEFFKWMESGEYEEILQGKRSHGTDDEITVKIDI